MNKATLKKIENVCIVLIIALAFIFVIGVIYMQTPYNNDKIADITTVKQADERPLTQEINLYPSNCILLEKLPELEFIDEQGSIINLEAYKGKTVVMTFWNSWCGDCKRELAYTEQFQQLLSNYPDVEWLLINRLDGVKETKQQAIAYLKQNNIAVANVFDQQAKAYKALGIKAVPTTLVIDGQGVLRLIRPDAITDVSEMQAIIEYVVYGGSYATQQFIKDSFTNALGGIYTNYTDRSNDLPSGYDVLSESQGIMLEYAIKTGNKELFDSTFLYLKDQMFKNPLAAWVKPNDKVASDVNALLDDLRIYKALNSAQKLWGGYEKYTATYAEAIYKYNTSKDYLVDSYDFKNKLKSKRFTLCYADFNAVETLSQQNKRYAMLYQNTLKIVKQGYISDEFPLYYSWYDYDRKVYKQDQLNMAEAMYTLYHLAQIGELKPETIQWLKSNMEQDGIKARYTTNGEVVEGYDYRSTAVNALVVLIANEIGDQKLRSDALKAMEKLRNNDAADPFNGSFGHQRENISAFDQLMPLLAYADIEARLNNQ